MNEIIIQNINNYTQTVRDGNLFLSLKPETLTEIDFMKNDFRNSHIIYCKINGNILNEKNYKKYKKLLLFLYSKINKTEILEYTTLNLKTNPLYDKGFKGFKYYAKLGFSIQGADSYHILRECLSVIKRNGVLIEIKIQLKDNQIINYKNYYNL